MDGFSTFFVFSVFSPVLVIPWIAIYKKAGLPWWIGLAMAIPMVNLLLLWVFAFTRWPGEERVKALELTLD